MAEAYKAKESVSTYFTVNHGGYLASVVLRIEAQCVSGSNGMCKSEVDDLEDIGCRFPVGVEFAKHCRMKGVMDGRRNLGRDAPMSLGINQQHTRSGI